MRAGIVVVPIDLRMTRPVIERIAGITEATTIAIDDISTERGLELPA